MVPYSVSGSTHNYWTNLKKFQVQTLQLILSRHQRQREKFINIDSKQVFILKPVWPNQGTLTEREGTVQLTSLYQPVQNSCFLYCKHYFLSYKTSYLNGEVICTEPFPSVCIPWPQTLSPYWQIIHVASKIGKT